MTNRDKKKNSNGKLIPFEKSKHVIYLDNRGKPERKHTVSGVVLIVTGLLCIAYCIGIFLVGFGTYFFLVWGVLGLACILLAVLINNKKFMSALPVWFKVLFVALTFIGLLLFASVEGLILSRYNSEAAPGADYCLVLGAQWKSDGPSEVLRRRLNRAIAYLNENPDTIAVVSGGRGGNESIAEAIGMQEYLINAGISQDRILTETASKNTYENLVFSRELMDTANARIVIVTNNFHVYRALKIAERQGYGNVEGHAASSVTGLVPNNLLREFIGVLKDFLLGNL